VREWMRSQKKKSAKIDEILGGTDLSIVQVWLASLLGGFGLKRIQKDINFYKLENIELQDNTIAQQEVA
jgi:hypothetical protein